MSGNEPGVDDWGIQHHWLDASDEPQSLSAEAVERLRQELGRPPTDQAVQAPIVTRPGRRLPGGPAEVRCEDGSLIRAPQVLPADFPTGYHRLLEKGRESRLLIVSPGVCWLPPDLRWWGLAVQVYAARSRDSWGIGDLADLAKVREVAQERGARFLLLNPLHAVAPTHPQQDSPYLPATRRFRNPLYLRVEDVPGAAAVDLTDLADSGRSLDARPLLDRDESWRLKREALWRVFGRRTTLDPTYGAWRAQQGRPLEEWATWCAISERYGPDWRSWPAGLRRPEGEEVRRFAGDNRAAVDFHGWLQWLLDAQLTAACDGLTVVQDLPVGFDGGGADGWVWQDETAQGVEIGAPPDQFNLDGQRWGAPPLLPWALRASGYEPFIASVRASMAATGGLRIDHVMGLFRLWWVPDGCSAADGGYVRYPAEDLLDIVALESHRAKSVVVGEDLGTVEPGVRDALRERQLLSCRLMWFEDDPPSQWPAEAMAAVTTHDLPTVAGLWSGADLAEQQSFRPGSADRLRAGRDMQLGRLLAATGLAQTASDEAAVRAAHRALGASPSAMVVATLDDLVGARRRPNLPGVAERPNWRIPLPVAVDDLREAPGLQTLDGLRRRRS